MDGKLHDMTVDAYYRDCVTTDRLDLRNEQERVASDLAYWSEKYADAVGAYETAKMDLETTASELTITVRAVMELAPPAEDEPKAPAEPVDPLDDPVPPKKKPAGARPRPPSVPKVTEKMVDSAVHVHPRYLDAKRAVIAAEVEKERVRGRVGAIKVKAEQLIGLGAHERLELSKDPVYRRMMEGGREVDETKR